MKRLLSLFLFSIFIGCLYSCHGGTGADRSLTALGFAIHYEVYGDAAKTVFLIHGWTGNTRVWKYQLEALSSYRVIAVDLPGNGKSSKDEKARYTMELFADAVAAVAKQENVTRAFFIGHSMGFAAIEVIAQKYPDLCAGLACLDGLHLELPEDPAALEQWLLYNRGFARSLETEKGREDFISALLLPDTPQLLKDEVLVASRAVPLAIGKAMIGGIEADQKYWQKRTVNIPCLTVCSPVYGWTPEYKAEFKRTYPQAEFHDLTNASHFFMLELPYRTNQLILDFLEKHYK